MQTGTCCVICQVDGIGKCQLNDVENVPSFALLLLLFTTVCNFIIVETLLQLSHSGEMLLLVCTLFTTMSLIAINPVLHLEGP